MFRLFKSLVKPQSVPLQILSKTSKFTLLPLHHFLNKIPSHNHSLSYHPSAFFSAGTFTKSSKKQYIEDLYLIEDPNAEEEELASYQQILQKYTASQDFADFTQEESAVLLQAFNQLGNNLLNIPEREDDTLNYYEEAFAFAKTKGIKDSKELAYLYHGLGTTLLLHKRIDEALVNFDKSQDILNKIGVDDDSVYVFIQGYSYQGAVCLAQGDLDKAEGYFQAALEAVPETNGVEHFLMEIYENLAFVNFKKDNFEKGQEYAIKALDLLGESDGINPALLRELASSFYHQGKLDDALSYADKLYNALQSYPEADKNQVIENLVLIGNIYTQKSDFANAFAYFKEALDILEKSPEAFQDFSDPENLYLPAAFTYFAEGKDQEAAELFNPFPVALSKKNEKKFNKNVFNFLSGQDSIIFLNYRNLPGTCSSERVHKGVNIIRDKHGESSFEVAVQLASWALTLETNQNTKKGAYDTYQESLKIFEKLGDQCIPDVIHNTTRLADLSRFVGNPGESAEYCRKALKLIHESGQNLDWLDDLHRLLGAELWYGGEKAEGLEHLEKAVRLCEESGDRSGKLQFNCYFLADAYFERTDFQKAEEIAKKALQLCLLKFGKGHSDTKETLSLLLKILHAQKKTDEITKILQSFGISQAVQQSIVMENKSH